MCTCVIIRASRASIKDQPIWWLEKYAPSKWIPLMKKNSTPICPKFDENTFLVMTEVELCWKEEVSKSWALECKFHICLVVLERPKMLNGYRNSLEKSLNSISKMAWRLFALGCVHSDMPIWLMGRTKSALNLHFAHQFAHQFLCIYYTCHEKVPSQF